MVRAARLRSRPVPVLLRHRRGCRANPSAAHPSTRQALQVYPSRRSRRDPDLCFGPIPAVRAPPPPGGRTNEIRLPARDLLRGNGTPWSLQCRRADTPTQGAGGERKGGASDSAFSREWFLLRPAHVSAFCSVHANLFAFVNE